MFQFVAMLVSGYRWLALRCLLKRITTLAFLACVFSTSQTLDSHHLSAWSSEKPHVVVIMADDMGFSDLGCFGGEIRTPHLDALATGGLRYTNFYSENMCWVSRASMLTGVYHKTSLRNSTLNPQCATLPGVLKSAGYQTRMSGKWHLAGRGNSVYPLDRGFEHWYGILGGAASFFAPHSLSRDRENVEGEYQKPDYYFTHAISENAVEVHRRSRRWQATFSVRGLHRRALAFARFA